MMKELKIMFNEYDVYFYSAFALVFSTFNISVGLSDFLIFCSIVYTIIKIVKELKTFNNGKKGK